VGGEGVRRRDDGGNVNNVQYKSNQNCHCESSLYNEYIQIKIIFKKYELSAAPNCLQSYVI
jgi:hypothetical protein